MILKDYHIHTYYSSDSSEDPENIIKAAIDKGLVGICFTDHMDLDWPETKRSLMETELGKEGIAFKKKLNGLPETAQLPQFTFNPEPYVADLSELQKKYSGKLDIKIGAEFGLRPGRKDLEKEYIYIKNHYKLDFCLGSLHLIDDADPYYADSWDGDRDVYIEKYFSTLLTVVNEYDCFDSLAHIDYVARYLPEMKEFSGQEIEEFADGLYKKNALTIDEVLKVIIAKEKALEINTGGLKKPYMHLHPVKQILDRYVGLGGTKFSFGSDAHSADRVGYGFSDIKCPI